MDLKADFDAQIFGYNEKAQAAEKASRGAKIFDEKLTVPKEARAWRDKADKAEDEYRQQRDRMRQQSAAALDQAANTLEPQEDSQELFRIQWEVR